MATKLRNLKVREISLVNRPANPGADILLIKAAGASSWKACQDCPSAETCKTNGGCAAEVGRRGRATLRREAERRSAEITKSLSSVAQHDADAATVAMEQAAALAKSDAHPLAKAAAARKAELLQLRRQGR